MVRTRFKWKCIFFSFIIMFNVFTKSLPINKQTYSISEPDTVFKKSEPPIVTEPIIEEFTQTYSDPENRNVTTVEVPVNASRNVMFRQHMRPGQSVTSYAVELTFDGDSFEGRVIVGITLTRETTEDDMVLYFDGLDIHTVRTGILSAGITAEVEFGMDDQQLQIPTNGQSQNYFVIVEYGGNLANSGRGLYRGHYNEHTYVGMNLHPTYARRVFPCTDEPTEAANIHFTFNDLDYTHVMTNSLPNDGGDPQFQPLLGPPHRWGMIAHNFININIPTANVLLYGRPGVSNQDFVASTAINFFYDNLIEWTDKPFLEIIQNQNDRMNIIALPDVSTDWHSLSIVGIWEPYIFMERDNSVKQRSIALPKIAEAIARQWFGYTIYSENWRDEWVVQGLASYAAWEVLRLFQTGDDVTMLDVNTLFVTEVIQESLLRDSYATSGVLETEEELFDEGDIRDHIGVNGMIKYKAPALIRMIRIVFSGADSDVIQEAANLIVNHDTLEAIHSGTFSSAVTSVWDPEFDVGDFQEYLESWTNNNGYPLLRVSRIRGSGVVLNQENFGFSAKENNPTWIPITYTTSTECNFDAEKIYPVMMFDLQANLNFHLDDEDWVLFNIQGQGYYRVTYDDDLWENIIEALEDPETRELIHPLNRATLVDDALNIARARRLDYDIAFRVVLSMEHETEYAVWKAFVRNMNFLRKRLVAYVDDDEDLDPDIYLRMVRRTIHAFEDEIGFYPDVSLVEPAMQSLTRGLVMDHACRANYQPCIAAAIDWFYDPDNNGVVNPNIPHDIRPAVYCTMVREGDEEVIEALQERLEIEPTQYERIVILESLACSQDDGFINGLLEETIAGDSPYGMEERVKIFAAVAESSHANADLARAFLRMRTSEIREMYGGPEKLEEVTFILAENMADEGQAEQFEIWATSQNNNLDDSQDAVMRALEQVQENLIWIEENRDYVYEWINENHAPTLMLSVVALCVSVMVGVFIQ